jgi:hypothetical protein
VVNSSPSTKKKQRRFQSSSLCVCLCVVLFCAKLSLPSCPEIISLQRSFLSMLPIMGSIPLQAFVLVICLSVAISSGTPLPTGSAHAKQPNFWCPRGHSGISSHSQVVGWQIAQTRDATRYPSVGVDGSDQSAVVGYLLYCQLMVSCFDYRR